MPRETYEVHGHDALRRELARLPAADRERVERALVDLAHAPRANPSLRALVETVPVGTCRLRIGPYRALVLLIPRQRVAFVITVFRRGGPASYVRALERHRARVRDVER